MVTNSCNPANLPSVTPSKHAGFPAQPTPGEPEPSAALQSSSGLVLRRWCRQASARARIQSSRMMKAAEGQIAADDARLLIPMMATAFEQGATLLNYVEVTGGCSGSWMVLAHAMSKPAMNFAPAPKSNLNLAAQTVCDSAQSSRYWTSGSWPFKVLTFAYQATRLFVAMPVLAPHPSCLMRDRRLSGTRRSSS